MWVGSFVSSAQMLRRGHEGLTHSIPDGMAVSSCRRSCGQSGAYGWETSVAEISICIPHRQFETNYLEVNEARAEVGNSSHPRLHPQAL